MSKDFDELYDYMTENEIATEEEISIALYFGGYDICTLQALLFRNTGYRSLEQIKEGLEEEEIEEEIEEEEE